MGNPLLVTMPWSAAAYAPGPFPWSGQPSKIAPAYATWQPTVAFAPSAPEFNYMFNVRDTLAIAHDAVVGTLAETNFSQLYAWTGATALSTQHVTNPSPAAWDPVRGRWFVGGHDGAGAHPGVYASADGLFWAQVGADLNSPPTTVIVRPSDGVLFALEGGTGTRYASMFQPAISNAWFENIGGIVGLTGGTCFLNLFVYWAIDAISPSQKFQTHTGANATSAVNLIITGAAVPFYAGGVAYAGYPAQSGAALCIFPGVPGATTYYRTSDAVNLTTEVMPFVFAAGDVVFGAGYDAANGVFRLGVAIAATNTAKFYSSPTGLTGTWSLTASFAHPPFAGLIVNGYKMIAPFAIGGGAAPHFLLSIDEGVSWHWTGLNPTASVGTLATSGTQYLYVDGNFYSRSLIAGLSPAVT